MRKETYPGSEVTLVQTLEPGSNYARYLASYESDGNTIYALLTVPNGEPPATGWPVIVFNHGYIPPAQYRTTERYVAYVDALARNGSIVFKSDYRGHGDSEGRPASAYGDPDYTVDVLNAVAAMRAYPGADPDRIGMWGHSMGGHITLRAMVTTDDVKVGVIWAGVAASYTDLMTRWSRPNRPTPVATYPGRRWRTEFTETYGSPEENPEFWASIAPITYVEDASGPIQLHHGTADDEVPARLLGAALRGIAGRRHRIGVLHLRGGQPQHLGVFLHGHEPDDSVLRPLFEGVDTKPANAHASKSPAITRS